MPLHEPSSAYNSKVMPPHSSYNLEIKSIFICIMATAFLANLVKLAYKELDLVLSPKSSIATRIALTFPLSGAFTTLSPLNNSNELLVLTKALTSEAANQTRRCKWRNTTLTLKLRGLHQDD